MPTAAQANQRVLLHPQWQGGHPNELQGRVAPTDRGTSCHHPVPPRAGKPNKGPAEEERSIININGGPPTTNLPKKLESPTRAQRRGGVKASTPGAGGALEGVKEKRRTHDSFFKHWHHFFLFSTFTFLTYVFLSDDFNCVWHSFWVADEEPWAR